MNASTAATHDLLPHESVRVWVSQTVEADLVMRGAFPQLRQANRYSMRSGISIHWCDPAMAEAVLSDAARRRAEVGGALRNAYNALIKHCNREIQEAKARPAWLAGAEPRLVLRASDFNRYACTRSQLRLMGMPAEMALPGDAGGPSKKAQFIDARGQKVGVTRAEDVWPGTFRAEVECSKADQSAAAQRKQFDRPLQAIETLPASLEQYRAYVEDRVLSMGAMVMSAMQPSQGYHFAQDVVDEAFSRVAELVALVRNARVIGQSRDAVKQQYLASRAKQDEDLQSFLRCMSSLDGQSLE